jgi:hypothetical protein
VSRTQADKEARVVKVKCPKCGRKYQFVKCTNCDSRDGTLREVIRCGTSDDGDDGAFCRKCGSGITSIDCECGCHVHGALFRDGGFLMYSITHDLDCNSV